MTAAGACINLVSGGRAEGNIAIFVAKANERTRRMGAALGPLASKAGVEKMGVSMPQVKYVSTRALRGMLARWPVYFVCDAVRGRARSEG